MVHIVLLIACAVAIYLSCEWFVNAVEWLGQRLNIATMAVGTILAAFGTALPESVVTLVAVTTGPTAEIRNIGVGAAMGGPLVLATVAYGVTGAMLLLRRRHQTRNHSRELVTRWRRRGKLSMPLRASATMTPARSWPIAPTRPAWSTTSAGLWRCSWSKSRSAWWRLRSSRGWVCCSSPSTACTSGAKSAAAPAATRTITSWRRSSCNPAPCDRPRTAVLAQTLGALAVIFVSSQIFVHQLDAIGPMLGLSGAVTALLLSPIATELPEIMNAIIWVRQGKTQLALANISGAMMIQATVPSGLGLLFTDWRLDHALLWSAVITMAAITYLLATMRANKLTPRRLAMSALFYLIFAAGLIPILI